ncbi:MAG: PTPA-CTERM sorting domain-containing protein [Nodosilinea sp.]
MNFKSLVIAGISVVGCSALMMTTASPAHASLLYFGEPQAGDPSRNNTATSADNTGITLPATGDAILIGGTLEGGGNATEDVDWFSFTIGKAGTLSLSFQSSHLPTAALQAMFYLASDPSTPLTLFRPSAPTTPITSLSFNTPGGDGAKVKDNYAAGTSFLVHILGNATDNPDYSFQAELQPELPPPPPPPTSVPTPALLPGLIGMGVAAWRKRQGEPAVSPEVIKA